MVMLSDEYVDFVQIYLAVHTTVLISLKLKIIQLMNID